MRAFDRSRVAPVELRNVEFNQLTAFTTRAFCECDLLHCWAAPDCNRCYALFNFTSTVFAFARAGGNGPEALRAFNTAALGK